MTKQLCLGDLVKLTDSGIRIVLRTTNYTDTFNDESVLKERVFLAMASPRASTRFCFLFRGRTFSLWNNHYEIILGGKIKT